VGDQKEVCRYGGNAIKNPYRGGVTSRGGVSVLGAVGGRKSGRGGPITEVERVLECVSEIRIGCAGSERDRLCHDGSAGGCSKGRDYRRRIRCSERRDLVC